MSLKCAYLALGSNISNRLNNIKSAIEFLENGSNLIISGSSPIYKNRPIGIHNGNEFYNLVIEIHTILSPKDLLLLCKKIEVLMGRIKTDIWQNRIIDLDIILYEGFECDEPELTIPHKRLLYRDFVLKPLYDLNKNITLKGKSIEYHLSLMDLSSLFPLDEHAWPTSYVNHIVAVSKNNVIGLDGVLPWEVKEDWNIFLRKTKKSILIMGRLSFLEMIKEPTWSQDRLYVVVTKKGIKFNHKNVLLSSNILAALSLAKKYNRIIWVCGGYRIYKETLPYIKQIHLTRINKEFKGDTFYPDYKNLFKKCLSSVQSSNNKFSYNFEIWTK